MEGDVEVTPSGTPEVQESGSQDQQVVDAASTGQDVDKDAIKPADWTTHPLPQGHPAAAKYKTLGDFHKAYESSSSEGRRLYQENQRLQQLVRQAQAQQQVDVSARPPEKKPYFGYGSKEAWTRAISEDFDGTMQKAITEGAKPLVQEEIRGLRDQFKLIQEKLHEETRAAHYQRLLGKYPDAAAGSPGNDAAGIYAERNPWVGKFMQEHPDVDPFDVVYKLGNFDVLAAKLADAEKRLAEHGKRSQSARPGTGAAKQIKQGSSPSDAVDAAAEDMRNAGEPVSDAVLEAARKAASKHLTFTR